LPSGEQTNRFKSFAKLDGVLGKVSSVLGSNGLQTLLERSSIHKLAFFDQFDNTLRGNLRHAYSLLSDSGAETCVNHP
jgi:hypothetical protein